MYNFGIPDERFIRGNVPITKEEIRVITLSKLRIGKSDIILDVGAGTGSISIESALLAPEGKIYAVERNEEALSLIKLNMEKFGIENIDIVRGEAPEALLKVPPVDKVILGGTGGRLDEIMDWVDLNLKNNGRVVINAITIETVYKGIETFKKREYDFEIINVSVAKGVNTGNLTMMKGQNPVYVITGKRKL